MLSSAPRAASHLVPLMRYRDVGVASEWLCAAFGFEMHFAAKAPDGEVFYAELRLDDSMVMLGAAGAPDPDAVLPPPDNDRSLKAQSCYVVEQDLEGHYEQAKRAGAAIVLDLKMDSSGGRGYSCKDPEGHIWNFGTYDPWKAQSNAPRSKRSGQKGQAIPGLGVAVALTLLISVVSGYFVYAQIRGGVESGVIQRLRDSIGQPPPQTGTGSLATGGIDEGQGSAQKKAQAETTRALKAMAALQHELERERQAKIKAYDEAATARAEAEKASDAAAASQAEATRAKADRATATQTEVTRGEAARSEVAQAAGTVTFLKTELARQTEIARTAVAELQSMRDDMSKAQNDKAAAVNAVREAQEAAAKDRAVKDSALKALADAGVQMITLEQDLKKAKAAAIASQLAYARAQATSQQRAKQRGPNAAWPYSEW